MTIYRDQLEAVYKLIERPDAWMKGRFNNAEYNRGAQGDTYMSKRPTCFCLVGAARYAISEWYESIAEFSRALDYEVPGELLKWNDAPERTHQEVLALLKSAIERATVRP